MTEQIIDIHTASKGRYGVLRVHAALRRRGYQVEQEAGGSVNPAL